MQLIGELHSRLDVELREDSAKVRPDGVDGDAEFGGGRLVSLPGSVFIPVLEIIVGYSPVAAGSALVPVTVMTVLFGLGLASLIPPLTASAMNSAPDSLAGLASGVNNAVARAAGLLWIAALPPITGLTGAAYADPAQFRSSFAQISWICAAAFASAAALAATFITRPDRPTPAPRTALIQTPVPHLTCPVAFGHAPGQTRSQDSSPASANPTTVEEATSPGSSPVTEVGPVHLGDELEQG